MEAIENVIHTTERVLDGLDLPEPRMISDADTPKDGDRRKLFGKLLGARKKSDPPPTP